MISMLIIIIVVFVAIMCMVKVLLRKFLAVVEFACIMDSCASEPPLSKASFEPAQACQMAARVCVVSCFQ